MLTVICVLGIIGSVLIAVSFKRDASFILAILFVALSIVSYYYPDGSCTIQGSTKPGYIQVQYPWTWVAPPRSQNLSLAFINILKAEESRKYLHSLKGQEVLIKTPEEISSGVFARVGGTNINAELVRRGYAEKIHEDHDLERDTIEAKKASAGLLEAEITSNRDGYL